MGSVTASPVIMMVLMLALCRVCTTGGGGGGDGVCDCLTCDHDGPDVGSEQGAYNWRGGGGKVGSVTASPVIMMVLMLALSRVRTTGEGVVGRWGL